MLRCVYEQRWVKVSCECAVTFGTFWACNPNIKIVNVLTQQFHLSQVYLSNKEELVQYKDNSLWSNIFLICNVMNIVNKRLVIGF